MIRKILQVLPLLIFTVGTIVCLGGILVFGAPIEPAYGKTPVALPPTYTPEAPSEHLIKPGLTIQSFNRPGVSIRIEEVRQEECSPNGWGVFAGKKLVVFYTTNNAMSRNPLTRFLCISLNSEVDEKDSWIWVKSKMVSGKQELYLVVDTGWRVVQE